MLNTKLLVLHNKDWIVQKLYGSSISLNFPSIDLKKPSVIQDNVSEAERITNTSLGVDGVNVKPCSQQAGPHQSCVKALRKKMFQDSHHRLRLPAIFGDTGIVHHYSNWWCNPKGQLFTHFWKERKRVIMRRRLNYSE